MTKTSSLQNTKAEILQSFKTFPRDIMCIASQSHYTLLFVMWRESKEKMKR